jgi:hypothetical protein
MMDELIKRLEAAVKTLLKLEHHYRQQGAEHNAARVKGKREGVTLALSYLRDEAYRLALVERETEEEVFEPSGRVVGEEKR